jgi:hypothetical protein
LDLWSNPLRNPYYSNLLHHLEPWTIFNLLSPNVENASVLTFTLLLREQLECITTLLHMYIILLFLLFDTELCIWRMWAFTISSKENPCVKTLLSSQKQLCMQLNSILDTTSTPIIQGSQIKQENFKLANNFFIKTKLKKKLSNTKRENLVITKIQGMNNKPWKIYKGLLRSLSFLINLFFCWIEEFQFFVMNSWLWESLGRSLLGSSF